MSESTYDELHTLLDSLTPGDRVKATWTYDNRVVTAEGPVHVEDGGYCECHQPIRWSIGGINSALTSFEVTRTEEVTVTRDDEVALHALLDSLEDGQEATAEWRDEEGSMILTGPVRAYDYGHFVCGYNYNTDVLRWGDGELHPALRAVTVHRNVVKRWEREGHE